MTTTKVENSTVQLSNAANVKKKWGNVIYNVMEYKAKGDGVTDDTSAIQNCIDAVIAAGGGIVFFPSGTYMLKSVQVIGMTPRAIQDPNLFVSNANNIKFIGTGDSILTTGDGLPATRTEILFFYKCNNIEVSGIQFKGNNTGLVADNNNCAVGMVSCVGVWVHDNQFYGFQGSYVGCSWLFNAVFERNKFTVSGGSGIDVAFVQNVTIRNNYMVGSGLGSNSLGTNGIQVAYDIPNAAYNETGVLFVNGISNHLTIEENQISSFSTGMNLADLVDTKIINNNIINNYIASDSLSWGLVLGNTRSDFTMEGIEIASNSFYQNGSTVSGGGITMGVGTAIGIVVNMDKNDFFDNSHIAINIGSSDIILRASRNRFYNRSNENQTTLFAGLELLEIGSLVTDNPGYNPVAPTLPAVPAGTTLADAVTNTKPYPVTVYQEAGTGLHIVTPTGTNITVSGGEQKTFRLPPYHKAYFATVNTSQWNWVPE